MRLAIALCAVAAAASIRAQNLEPVRDDPRAGLRVDTIIATVSDTAVLLSELRNQAVGKVRGLEERQGRPLTADERSQVLQNEFRILLRDRTMALAAKTLGLADPGMLEQAFQDELQREAKEQVRSLGTEQNFSRELQLQGRTWQSFTREQRQTKMRQFAEDLAVWSRIQKQQNLFVTPRMLRELYGREQARFVRPAAAIAAAVVFRGDQAAEHAAAAATTWREADVACGELAERFPGGASLGEVDASTLIPDLPLAKFALAGPQGAVSEVIPFQNGMLVAKIMQFRSARNGTFEDPEVQTELRTLGMEQVIGELREQAMQRAAARTEVQEYRPAR